MYTRGRSCVVAGTNYICYPTSTGNIVDAPAWVKQPQTIDQVVHINILIWRFIYERLVINANVDNMPNIPRRHTHLPILRNLLPTHLST